MLIHKIKFIITEYYFFSNIENLHKKHRNPCRFSKYKIKHTPLLQILKLG